MGLRLPLDPQRTLIVAELSANHGGSLKKAIETIRAAAEAGADAIKIQTYTGDTMTLDCEREEYLIHGGLWGGRRLYELYQEAHTPWEWHAELKAAAAEVGLPLFSTPFDRSAVDFLEDLGVPAYKVASFEVTDLELIASIARTRKPIVMSTGMATLGEVGVAVDTVRRVWQGEDRGLVLLKCVSAYPAPPGDMNLATIPHLAEAFHVMAGLSDHTLGTEIAVASVALGARVIEKHFTLCRADSGPDSAFSIEPGELSRLVANVRSVERAIGHVSYGPTNTERPNLAFRRSLVVCAAVKAGEPFTRENLRVLRPGRGLAPSHLDLVLGRVAAADIPFGAPLTRELIQGLEE